MPQEKHITTRELLRNFRKYKEMLQAGTVHVVYVKIGDEEELTMLPPKRKGNGADIMKAIRALKKPIRIVRDNTVFDGFPRTFPPMFTDD